MEKRALKSEEFSSVWAELNSHLPTPRWDPILCPYDEQSVKALNIPDEAKRFLIEAGLPGYGPEYLCFGRPEFRSLSALPDALPNRQLDASYRRYRLLGTNTVGGRVSYETPINYYVGSFLCLDEQQEGKVVAVDNTLEYSTFIVNSSVMHLAEFLVVLRRDSIWRHENYDYVRGRQDLRDRHGVEVADQLRQIDFIATEEPAYWWGSVLELEAGM